MIAILQEFDIKQDREKEFREAWIETTELIYEHFGSLGSRLHSSENDTFIAYAQWPDRETYENDHEWPQDLLDARNKMRETLKTGKPKKLHLLKLEVDLLRNTTF